MALLSLGLGTAETEVLASEALLDASAIADVSLDTTFQLADRGGTDNELLTPELDFSDSGFDKPGNLSPAYSPRSVASEDSGILTGVPDSDYLLTSLFGIDLSLSACTSEAQLLLDPPAPKMPEPHQAETQSVMSKDQLDRNRKNAEAARLNRQKKKRYMEDLEKTCSTLKTENVVLKTRCHEYQQKCSKLQSEVQYLKSVLMNESTLSSLIQNIPQVKGVKLTSSLSRKRSVSDEESQPTVKRLKQNSHSGGICLHVAKDVVSLEFCANCSKQASS